MHAFVTAVIEGRLRQAHNIFRADPGIARRGLLAATVLGDATAVREMLAADPAVAVAIDEEPGLAAFAVRLLPIRHHQGSTPAPAARTRLVASACG